MMRVCPVLPNVNRLPRSQSELARHDRNHQTRVRHGSSKMRRHVVRSFIVVFVVRTFRSELTHPPIQIAEHCGIGVFLDHQTRRRVLQEKRTQARAQVTIRDDRSHEVRHVMKSAASRSYVEQLLMHGMRSTTVSEIEGASQPWRSEITCLQ